MTLKQLRRTMHNRLRENPKIQTPELDADLIIMHALGINKTELITRDTQIPEAMAMEVNAYINRRLSGVPVQYIVGKCEFMSLDFLVNNDVLIPRADTEILVEAIIDKYKSRSEPINILDIGCGSGCIGVSLAKYLKNAKITEVDISKLALNIAKLNAERNNVNEQITYKHCDITNGIPDLGFVPDCIVSNPPYIKNEDLKGLQTEVINHEPVTALDGGADGMDFYRCIIKLAKLNAGGILAFEVGMGQAEYVSGVMRENGYHDIEIIPDLSGIERVVLGYK